MKNRLLLLLVAFIWGTTFIFQRISTGTMGPFAFTALRFTLGSVAILPLVLWCRKQTQPAPPPPKNAFPVWLCGLIIGGMLFGGSILQQQALAYTTAGKAAFITALYIVAVPLAGLFLHQPLRITHVVGGLLALAGVYALAVHTERESLNFGDLLTLAGVLFWTGQILFIDWFVHWYPGIYLAEGQFIFTALLGYIGVFLTGETITAENVRLTLIPLLYAGIMSSGVAYTLQIIGQAKVPPTEASMLMSCEMIFGALAGFLFLEESMTSRELLGCLLMSIGVFLSQLPGRILWAGNHGLDK